MEYMENGQLMLNKREAGKASELLWGGVAQALEALAKSRNMPRFSRHHSLRYFAGVISRETGDSSINNVFYQAEALHKNFYSVEMTAQNVATNVAAIRDLVSKLLSMIPPELVNQKAA